MMSEARAVLVNQPVKRATNIFCINLYIYICVCVCLIEIGFDWIGLHWIGLDRLIR